MFMSSSARRLINSSLAGICKPKLNNVRVIDEAEEEGDQISVRGRPFFCSWSGGKDSCLALYLAMQAGGVPQILLTMLIEDGERSRAHGIPVDMLKQQSAYLSIPLVTCSTSWEDYETSFVALLKEFKKEGIAVGVFGDIDLEEHLEWERKVCAAAGLEAYLPLCKKQRKQALEEFLDAGFEAIIVALNGRLLDKKYLGVKLNKHLLAEFEKMGIDPAGENGEFHTLVTGGPIFSQRLEYTLLEPYRDGDYWFQAL